MSNPQSAIRNRQTCPLAEIYGPRKFGLSFELFPPKTPAGDEALDSHVAALMAFGPSFVTCTYGAGGSTRDKTLDVVTRVKERHGVPVASHLTCVGATVEQLCDYLQAASDRGVDYIVALRGDPPRGETAFQPVAGGLRYANELVALVRERFAHFGVAVAGYPEKHQEAPDAATDLANLIRKADTGADVVVTQLFYNNNEFFDFRERAAKAGISQPIVPGVLPVTNLAQIQRITSLCGAKLPASFVRRLAERDGDDDWQFQVGVEFAAQQVQELIDAGAPGVHFYVLNKSQATAAVLERVKLPSRPD